MHVLQGTTAANRSTPSFSCTQAARESNVIITQALSNATSLNATSQELASEVQSTESYVTSLEAQARRDRENIAAAQVDALEAITTAEVVQSRIQALQRIIQRLSEELAATELLPSERFMEVEGTIVSMEEQAEQNQVRKELVGVCRQLGLYQYL